MLVYEVVVMHETGHVWHIPHGRHRYESTKLDRLYFHANLIESCMYNHEACQSAEELVGSHRSDDRSDGIT